MKVKLNSKITKKIVAAYIVIFITLVPFINIFPFNHVKNDLNNNCIKTQTVDSGIDPILWKLGKGLPGTGATMQPRLVNFTDSGEKYIVVGTNEGIATISLDGFINISYRTFGPVINFDIIKDISGDSAYDLVLITYDQDYPNLIAITSNNGSEIWKFKPAIEGIDPTTYATHDFITHAWDIKVINDINDDSIPDIAITSWFRLIVVSGKDGNELWINSNDFTNDVWKLEVLEDINGNGFDTIIAGSEEGKLGAFDSKDGTNLWSHLIDVASIPIRTIFGYDTEKVQNSIDDIKIISDADYDGIDDVLIAADDGYLRIISGLSGNELDNVMCFNMTYITIPLWSSISTSPYTSVKRIFMKSGVKIYEIPDINKDNITEYISIACDLDYTTPEKYLIYGKIFNINPESGFDKINITASLNWSSDQFYFGSYPEIINLTSSIQIYMYSLAKDGWEPKTSVINRYDINDKESENPTIVYIDNDEVDYSISGNYIPEKKEGHYLLNIGDINDDDIDDYAAWIIPSKIPSEITSIIKTLSGENTLPSGSTSDNIYRALLSEYTRILAINGSNGVILWDTSLLGFPYKFYRHYEYTGPYYNPTEIDSGEFHIYNRISNKIPSSWISGSDISWENEWEISTLLHVDDIQIEWGESSGNKVDLWDKQGGNYSIKANQSGNLWKVLFNLTIPVDFSDDRSLGVMEYTLSQIERFSAFKMQTRVAVNTSSSNWYNFTYEIYDVLSDKWVLCNWSYLNHTWNNHTYPDLYGGFNTTDRTNYTYFNLTNSYKYDHMYLITRGTENADPFVEFDYKSKTRLTNFLDSNHNIRIRINVTNGNEPFNLTIDYFGIGAFYWGLFGHQYDMRYILKYAEDSFTCENLLNLEIQDFEVINGTDDEYLDVVAVIGVESLSLLGYTNWSTRIRLFDIKNKEVFTKWSINPKYIPNYYVQIIPLNNSLNSWLISGKFQFGENYNCSHKLISDPHWDSQITHFDNYIESKVKMDYTWEITPSFLSGSGDYLYEFPGKTAISKDGKIGIIIGEYGWVHPYEWDPEYEVLGLTYIQIIDVNSRSIVSKIPVNNLISYGGSMTVGSIDFSSDGAGYRLLISYEDFDGDNYLDHVGLYSSIGLTQEIYTWGTEIIIYGRNSSDSNPNILFRKLLQNTYLPSGSSSDQNKLKMPFVSIGDCNNDGISDAMVGLQVQSWGGSWGDYCKGSSANFYDIYNSDENNAIELTGYYWEFDSYSCTIPYPWEEYEFVYSIENIGDVNGDNKSEILIERNSYTLTTTEWGGQVYMGVKITEILDVINRTTLYRINIDVDSVYPIIDLNEDGRNELLISREELIFCINSKFKIDILNPINEQIITSHNFNIEWDTDSNYDYFEVFVNGMSQGITTSKIVSVSLSEGWKKIDVVMHDKSGLIIAINTMNVLVSPNYIQLIMTFVIIGVAVGLYIVYKRFRKKEKEMVLIDKKIDKGGKK